MTPAQKAIIKQWFGVSRFVYNTTIKLLQDSEIKANWIPTFETSQMSEKGKRRIKSKSTPQMLTLSHYQFKQFIKHKAFEYKKIVLDVNEAYTSKIVSWTGEIVKNLGGSKTIKSLSTNKIMDRDLNGARGIFLRALVDTPWLRENLNLCIC